VSKFPMATARSPAAWGCGRRSAVPSSIIEAHGGRSWAAPHPAGLRATFRFTCLRKGTGEPKALWRKNFPRLFGEPGAARYRPWCVLLVVFVQPSYIL
jgi:hypothetical protein